MFAVLPIAVVWGLAYAVAVSVASMLAFNWFFLSRCTRSRWPTRGTGSRSPCSSSRRSSSASSRRVRAGGRARRRCSPRSRPRCSSTATSAPSSSGSRPRRRGRLQVERREITLGRRGRRGGLRARCRRAPRRDDPARGPAAGDASARRRLLPALASLLGVAIDRERLARRGARGRGAAAGRRDQDGAAAGGQPRPADAADGDLDLGGRARAARPGARRRRPRRAARDDPRRPPTGSTISSGTCSTSRACRPARPQPEPELVELDELVAAALDELGARRRAGRGDACPTSRRRCASTRTRSSACS